MKQSCRDFRKTWGASFNIWAPIVQTHFQQQILRPVEMPTDIAMKPTNKFVDRTCRSSTSVQVRLHDLDPDNKVQSMACRINRSRFCCFLLIVKKFLCCHSFQIWEVFFDVNVVCLTRKWKLQCKRTQTSPQSNYLRRACRKGPIGSDDSQGRPSAGKPL